jgi:flagellar protein FlaJ
MRTGKFRLRIARYRQMMHLKYDIKREYITVGIPVMAAVLIVIAALLTGHTFVIQDQSGTGGTGEEDARVAAYQALVAEMEESGDGGGGESGEGDENDADTGQNTEAQEDTPDNRSKDDLDHILVFAVLIAIIPYSIDAYFRKKLLKKRELAFSDFLFKLSELMRGGIDPIKGVIDLSTTDLGAIGGNVKGAASAMILGHSFADAMNDMAAALKSRLISKYINLLIQAAYTGGAVADLLRRTSEDMRTVIGIEREKDGNLKQYVVIFYLAQGIIVMLVYILSASLLPLIQGVGMEILGGSGVSDIDFERGFFHMIMLNALLGGIIVGQITEGEMKHGLKHSAILMILCYIACITLILPTPAAEDVTIELVSGGGQQGIGGVPVAWTRALSAPGKTVPYL